MFLPAFLSSSTRCTVLLNEAKTLSIVPLTPPEALLAICQSAHRTTKVVGVSLLGLMLFGLKVLMFFLIVSISMSSILATFLRPKVAR